MNILDMTQTEFYLEVAQLVCASGITTVTILYGLKITVEAFSDLILGKSL